MEREDIAGYLPFKFGFDVNYILPEIKFEEFPEVFPLSSCIKKELNEINIRLNFSLSNQYGLKNFLI